MTMSSIGTKETKGRAKPHPLAYFYGCLPSQWCQCDLFYRKGQLIPENPQNQIQREYLMFLEGSAFIENLPVKTRVILIFLPTLCCLYEQFSFGAAFPDSSGHMETAAEMDLTSPNLWPSSDPHFCTERCGSRCETSHHACVWTGMRVASVLNNPLFTRATSRPLILCLPFCIWNLVLW